jgi:hypothetical protein
MDFGSSPVAECSPVDLSPQVSEANESKELWNEHSKLQLLEHGHPRTRVTVERSRAGNGGSATITSNMKHRGQ